MLLFFSIFFSLSVFSSNINLFNEARRIEEQQIKSLLSSFNDNLETICNYQVDKIAKDDDRLNELLQKIELINNTCSQFLDEAKQDDMMIKLLTHKNITKVSLVKAATTIGLFLEGISENNDGFSLLNLAQQSEILESIKLQLNQLQISQQTILALISNEEIDLNQSPITEIVIEPNVDHDECIAEEVNLQYNLEDSGIAQENERLRQLVNQRKIQRKNPKIIKEEVLETKVKEEKVLETKVKKEDLQANSKTKNDQDILKNWGIEISELKSDPTYPNCTFDFCILSDKPVEKPESLELPNEILDIIMGKLSLKDQRSFAKTCRFNQACFKEHYNNIFNTFKISNNEFPMIKNMFLVDENWLIVFNPSKDSNSTRGDINKFEDHTLLFFYRIDSDSSFNLVRTTKLNLNLRYSEDFKGFLKRNSDDGIYLFFEGYIETEFYVYSIEDKFQAPYRKLVESNNPFSRADRVEESAWLAEKGFSKISCEDMVSKYFTFNDKKFLFYSSKLFNSIKYDFNEVSKKIKDLRKKIFNNYTEIRSIERTYTDIDSAQTERILKKYSPDTDINNKMHNQMMDFKKQLIEKSLMNSNYIDQIEKYNPDSQRYNYLVSMLESKKEHMNNNIEKFSLLKEEILKLKKQYEVMYEKIETFKKQIENNNENLLYYFINSEKNMQLKNEIETLLKNKEVFDITITPISLIKQTDEEILQEFEKKFKNSLSCSIS
jgi:hypothetical protein